MGGINDGSIVVTVYQEDFDTGGVGWTTSGTTVALPG